MDKRTTTEHRYPELMPSDIIIRDVPDEAREHLEVLAELCGCSLEEYVRRQLFDTSTPEQRKKFWDEVRAEVKGSGVTFTVEEILEAIGRERS
jgi:plasmid stability protein